MCVFSLILICFETARGSGFLWRKTGKIPEKYVGVGSVREFYFNFGSGRVGCHLCYDGVGMLDSRVTSSYASCCNNKVEKRKAIKK